MLGKLKFKTDMFEGVLDGGQDSIFVSDEKFSKLADTLCEMLSEETTDETDEAEEALDPPEAPAEAPADSLGPVDSPDFTDFPESEESEKPNETGKSEKSSPANETAKSEKSSPANESAKSSPAAETAVSSEPDEMSVARGMQALAGLAQSLKSEEGRRRLADSLVRTDETTGEASLSIPVPDKQTVLQLFGLLGKLLG